ncbi:MAG: metallophosphoesterase family protein [Ruminococcaceae bacterium]|nr:metallophosphoesterase family protein [Oscillospiraceae bacterium]
MKRILTMLLIFTLVFSNCAFAIKYSENGMTDGEATVSVDKIVYEQDFESVTSSTVSTYATASNSGIGATLTKDPAGGTNNVFRVGCYSGKSNPAITVKTDKYTSTDKTLGFVDGQTYTITVDLYYYSSTGRTSAEPYIWWNTTGLTASSKVMAKQTYSIVPGEWTTLKLTCQYKASVLSENPTWARITVPGSTNGDYMYVDNVKWTYAESEKEKVAVDWVSYEDFEDPTSYAFSTTASPENTMGYGGESGTKTTQEAVTVGDTTAFGMIGRGVKYSSSSSKIVQGTSRRLKIWNIFNTEQKTPLNGTAPTWSTGWDMFTEDDIGREFEVSLSVYCPSSDGAWPYTLPTEYDEEGNVKGTADTTRTYGFISGDEIDLDNDDTKPTIRVGLMGPGKDLKNVNTTWKYGSNMYVAASKAIEWNEWTEFKFIYTVTEDTIFTSATTDNPLVNAIGIDSSGGGVSLYYPSTFYVDNIMVKELTVTPNLYLESEDKVKADIYVPAGMIDGKDNAMVIAGIYDGNNLVDAKALTALSDATVTCEFDVNFAADLFMKLYLWDGASLVPYMNHVNWEVPTIEEFKAQNRIDRIAQSFHGDVYTQKAFNWYSTKISSGDIAYVEKTGDTPDWSKASYVESEPSIERLFNFLEYSAVRHKALVTGLTPNTEYYYKVGNKEFDVWSDTYTFKTSDNTTDDGRFFLMADPQSSSYPGALPKGEMLNYMIDEYGGEFILSAGDLVITHNIEQEWIDTFNAQSFTNPNITFNGAPGDHDTAGRESSAEAQREQQYSKHFNYPLPEGASKGITYYSFDYKDFHIAILDTTMLTNDGKDIGAKTREQLDWLEKDMKASDKKWKVVITHEQPQAGTLVSNKLTGTSYRRKVALMPVFTELGIDLVLGGDTHRYSRTYPIYGYGGDLNTETNKVEPFEGKTELGNPNPTIVKTETINGKETKFFDAKEGVTYVTLGSVNKSSVSWSANALNPEVSFIPSYDIVGKETGVTSGSIRNIGTYSVLDYVDGEIIISIYHYDYANPQNGGTLFDQFALTK